MTRLKFSTVTLNYGACSTSLGKTWSQKSTRKRHQRMTLTLARCRNTFWPNHTIWLLERTMVLQYMQKSIAAAAWRFDQDWYKSVHMLRGSLNKMAPIRIQSFCQIFVFSLIFPIFVAPEAELAPSAFHHRRLLMIETELIYMFKLIMRWEDLLHDEKEEHNFNSTEVKHFIQETEPLNQDALDNREFYTANPVGLYILTKRLTEKWRPYVEKFQEEKICGQPVSQKLTNFNAAMPSKKDLDEAAFNLINLQRLFDLKTDDIANGVVAGNKTQPLTPDMCYDIALAAEEKLEYYYAIQWYERAIAGCGREKETGKLAASSEKNKNLETIRKVAFRGLGAVYYKLKHMQKAVEVVTKALEHDPNSKTAVNDLKFYERVLRDGGYTEQDLKPTEPQSKLFRLYEGLCGGKIKQPVRRLSCFYLDGNNNPFTQVRVEVLRKNPRIVMFHNAISLNHTGNVLEGVDKLLRKSVISNRGYSKERQWANLYNHNIHVERMHSRFKQLTKIDYDLSETKYMAFNYGTGIPKSPFIDLDDIALHGGNSSTFMVFLSNVDVGGGVVFPWLKTVVQPEMGSALFWYNTKPSGKVDRKLLWGECPILLGSKSATFRVHKDYVNDPPKYGSLSVDLWDKW
ncbi:prolyl 4-hydroxylase subunit alpha-1-like [Lineus longissimus]|uniref:prolyl 4-hydroxylase subunit alpha-1-like n=1 Tax=Lineus longissimus TaxID=88925 RepID=UPI00315CB15F